MSFHRLQISPIFTATLCRLRASTTLTTLISGKNGSQHRSKICAKITRRSLKSSLKRFQRTTWGMRISRWGLRRHSRVFSASFSTSNHYVARFSSSVSLKLLLAASRPKQPTNLKTRAKIWTETDICTRKDRLRWFSENSIKWYASGSMIKAWQSSLISSKLMIKRRLDKPMLKLHRSTRAVNLSLAQSLRRRKWLAGSLILLKLGRVESEVDGRYLSSEFIKVGWFISF